MTTTVPPGRPTSTGQHFTPEPTAAFLWEQIRSVMPPVLPSGKRLRVVDPAAGEGALLRPLNGVQTDLAIGLEIDPVVAKRGRRVGVEVGDGLLDHQLRAASFDVAVANPPFGRASDLLTEDQWRQLGSRRGPSIWGEWSANSRRRFASRPLEQLFVERCLEVVSVGGWLALILPDGLLANRRSQAARDWILQRARPAMIVALPSATFRRPGLHAMAHLVLLKRKTTDHGAPQGDPCWLVQRPSVRLDLSSLMATISTDLQQARDGHKIEGISSIDPGRLRGSRWDAGYWQGQQQAHWWSPKIRDAPLGDFVENLTYGPIVTGSKPTHVVDGIVSIRQGDFTGTGLRLTQALRVALHGDHDPQRSRVPCRDQLLPRSGAGALGRNRIGVYLLEEEANIGCFVDRIRLVGINPFYVWLFLRTQPGWGQIKAAFNGVGTPNINFEEIRSLRIPQLSPERQDRVEAAYKQRILPLHVEERADATEQAVVEFSALIHELEQLLMGKRG